MKTLSRYQYEGVASAKISWLHQYACCQLAEEWERDRTKGEEEQGTGVEHELPSPGRQLRYLIAHAKLKLNYLPTVCRRVWERVGQPLFQSHRCPPPQPVLPQHPPPPIAALPFQSDCFRGCLCGPQIGFLLCRTALRIEFELIPLTRPADLCPSSSLLCPAAHLHPLPAKANLIILIIIAHTFRSPNPSQPRVRAPD